MLHDQKQCSLRVRAAAAIPGKAPSLRYDHGCAGVTLKIALFLHAAQLMLDSGM